MKRTISARVGLGCVNHNTRKFHAKNTDPERSHLNITYCEENIKAVYHELFDEALARYNAKQTRADRKIKDYYEKIRASKQEKTFHEIILQVGNKDDMHTGSDEGELAVEILEEYMTGFRERNPQLRVFSAHLHMDEATPHLHIDFVPFTTGSKRGLETRVSLKQALAAQGFQGGSRGDTEWNQWVRSEKDQLSLVMQRHGIEWEKKDTHEKQIALFYTPITMNSSFSPISSVTQRSIADRVSIASFTNSEGTISGMFRCMIFCHSLLVTQVSSNISKDVMISRNILSRKKKNALSSTYSESCRRNFLPAPEFPFLNSR